MRQQVIYSALIMAVAPVATMMATGTYQKVNTPQVATAQGVTLLKTTPLTTSMVEDINWFEIELTNQTELKGTLKIKYANYTVTVANIDVAAGTKTYGITQSGQINNQPIEIVFEGTGTVTDVKLVIKDTKKDDFKAKFAELLQKAKDYITRQNTYGDVTDANNRDLTLVRDICDGKINEFTLENFERFDLYNGLTDLTNFLSTTVKKIEVDHAKALLDKASEPLEQYKQYLDDNPKLKEENPDLYQAIKDALDENKGKITDFEEYAKGDENVFADDNLDKVKNATDKLLGLNAYVDYQIKLDKVNNGIGRYEALLDEYKKSVGSDDGAKLGIYQENAFRTSPKRLAGIKEAYEMFKTAAATAYDEQTGTFTAPTDKQPTGGNNYATIEKLLGTSEEVKKNSDEIGVLENIGYLQYCAQQYKQRFEDVLTAIDGAETTYNTALHNIETAVLAEEAEDTKCEGAYTKWLNQKKDELFQAVAVGDELKADPKIKKGEEYLSSFTDPTLVPGFETLEAWVKEVKKNGWDISYTTLHSGSGWGAKTPDFSKKKTYVPAQLWENYVVQLEKKIDDLKNELTDAIDDIHDEYTKEITQVTGTDDDAVQVQAALDEAKSLLDKGAAAVYEDDIKKIQQGIDELAKDVNAKNSDIATWVLCQIPLGPLSLGDPYDIVIRKTDGNKTDFVKDMTGHVTAEDFAAGYIEVCLEPLEEGYKYDFVINTNATNYTEVKVTDAAIMNPAWLADYQERYQKLLGDAQAIMNNAANANNEYDAYQALLATADDLAKRLKDAGSAIDDLTKDMAAPAYKGSEFFGYKDIDNLETDDDEAAENTHWAERVTNYVRLLREAAEKAYGDGKGTGAQMMKNGHPTEKTVVSTASTDGWTVPANATVDVENGKLTLPTGGNSRFEVGAITKNEVRVHVKISGLPDKQQLWCYLLTDGGKNMFNKGQVVGVDCDKSYGQANGEVVFTLTGVPTLETTNAKLQFFTSGVPYSVSDIYITEGPEADVDKLVIPFNTEKGADFDLNLTRDEQKAIQWEASGMTNPHGDHVVSKAFKLNAGTYRLSYELSEAADVYQNLFRIIDATTKPENIDNPVTIVGSSAGKYDKMTNAQLGAIEGYIEGFNNNTITIEFELKKNVPVMFDWWCTNNHKFTLQNISLEEVTPIYDEVSDYVSQLEKGGKATNAYAATENYITYRKAYDAEVLALNNDKGEKGLYQLVKDLEIYNIPTDALGGKTFKQVIDGLQKALDDGPKATIATISKNDPIADGNWDEDHWNALLALSYTNVVFDDGNGDKTIAQYKALIDLAKAQYEFDSFENSVAQLRDQIYGTDGHLTAKGDGLVDEALADFETEKKASFDIVNSAEWNTLVAQYQTELAAKNPTWTAGQVLKKAEDNATAYLKKHKFGTEANYTAIEALWNDLKAAIQNTALNDGKKKTDDDSKGAWYLWNEYTKVKVSNDDLAAIQDNTDKLRQLNDDLQKLKDILDASMQKQPTDGAAIEKVNDIVLSEKTNTEKLAEYTRNAASIAAAYDKMVPLYQAVRDHLNDVWDLADDVTAAENATKVIASDDDVYGTPEGRHVFSNRLISFEGAGTGIDGKGDPVSVDAFAGTKIKVAKIDADGNKVLDDQGNQVFVETDVTSLDKIGDIIAKYNYNLVDWVKAYDDDEFNSVMAQLDAYGVFDQTNPLLNDRLVQKTLIDAANNKAAYDELLAIKQQLTTRIDTYLNDLQDPATYPAETDEAKALIDIITTYYKPVPTDMTPLVEQAYINGEAYSQGSLLSNRKPDVAAYKKSAPGETWDDTYGFSTEAPDQVLYYVMKDSLDHLDNLMANFNDKYNSYVTAKNQAVFDDKIKAAYDEIYQLYDKRVLALRDNFSDLKREELQTAYTAAFKTLTEELYKTPNALKKALVDAQANMTTANGKNEDYDPAADLAIFDGIKNDDVLDPFDTFIVDMKKAANVVNNLYKDYEESTGKITTTWNAIKGFYATAKTPAPYETFENIYLADGTKFVDADTKYDYLYESRNDVRDAKALNTKIQDAKWLDADLKNCADYKDFDALVSGNAGNKTMPAIDLHLKAKLNEAAKIDLNNRIIIAQKEKVTPDAQSFMGQLIKVTDAEGNEHTIGAAETYKDLEGNEKTIDLKKNFYTKDELPKGYGQPKGFGPADAKGRYYNYKNALGEEAYNELVTKFESLVAGTIGAAQEYNKKFAANGEYFNAIDDQPNVLLPNENYEQEELDKYIVGFNSTSYQFVRDLFGKYTETTAFKDLFAPYAAKYQAFIDNVDYNDMMAAFYNKDADDGLWKQAYDGITSLYVGNDFVGKLNELKKDWEDETANPTEDPAKAKKFIEDLTQELKDTENDARVAEYTEMKDELNKLKAEYNQMMAEQGNIYDQAVLDIAAAKVLDPNADVSELETKRDDAEKRREELQQKFDNANNEQLNIDKNIADLEGYEADRQNDQPVKYADYVETERNVALIKAEIALEAGTIKAEEIVAKYTALSDAIDHLLATPSEYLPGNPLLLEFQNPKSQYFDDFGLYEYYLNKDVAAVKELIDSYKEKLTKLQESINIANPKTGNVNYVLLYEEKIKTQLAQFDKGGQSDLAQLDNLLNNAEYTNSYRQANQERLDRAASHVVAYERLKGEIKAVNDLIPAAEEKIAGLGFTKEDGQIDKGDFSTQLKRLAILEMRLKTLYLQGDAAMLDENTTLNNDMFDGTYTLERFMNGFNVEAKGDIVEKYSLDTDDANLGTYTKDGQVELPVAFGLTAITSQINQIVQGYVDKLAIQKYNEAYKAFNDLAAEVNALVMRKADKEELLFKLYKVNKDVKDETTYELDGNGNMIVKEHDTSFQKQLFDLEKLKITQDINSIAQYVEDVDAYIASLKVDFTAEVEDNIAGDVDGNKDVNIFDLTYILKLVNNPSFYEEQKTAAPEKVEKSDLNRDGHIDVVDLGIFIDIMSGDTGYLYEQGVLKARAAKTGDRIAAEVVSTNGNSQRIAIALDNVSEFTAFQMDVTMPKGMHIVNVELTDRASEQTLYSNDWNGKTRIVAFTSSKAAISGSEGALLYIDVESDADYKGGNVKYDDILFLTTQSRGVRLQMNGETTGIMSRLANAADAAKQTIYNMGGRVMNGLKKGVNILRGENGETEKVIRK